MLHDYWVPDYSKGGHELPPPLLAISYPCVITASLLRSSTRNEHDYMAQISGLPHQVLTLLDGRATCQSSSMLADLFPRFGLTFQVFPDKLPQSLVVYQLEFSPTVSTPLDMAVVTACDHLACISQSSLVSSLRFARLVFEIRRYILRITSRSI